MDPNLTFRRGEHVAAEVGDELFLVEPTDGEAYRLGGAGPRMWELLGEGRSIAEAAATIAAETAAEPARVEGDLRRLVDDLVRIGALLPRAT